MAVPPLGGSWKGKGLRRSRVNPLPPLPLGNQDNWVSPFCPELIFPEGTGVPNHFHKSFRWDRVNLQSLFRQAKHSKIFDRVVPAQPPLSRDAEPLSALLQSTLSMDADANQLFLSLRQCVCCGHSRLFICKLQPRFGERKLSIFGLACMATGLAVMALARDAWMLFPAVTVVALGTGTSIPSLTALVSLRVPDHEQGRLMGGTQTLFSLTNIIGPTLAGVTFELIAFSAPYFLGSILAIIALLALTSYSSE